MRIKDFERGGVGNFNQVSSWVQLYNILLYGMTESIAKAVATKIETFLEVEVDLNGWCSGELAKAQVHLNFSNPLKCQVKVPLGSDADSA